MDQLLSRITTTAWMKQVYRYCMVAAAAKAVIVAMAATAAMAVISAMAATFETAAMVAMVAMAWVQLIGKHEASQVRAGENRQDW